MPVPQVRIRSCNAAPVRPDGDYVLYWMVAFRRTAWNFALDRAIEHARSLGKPLVVFEALRAGYRWASDRHHAFILQGMADTRAACIDAGITYVGHVEPRAGDGRGLLDALASRAAVVVTDDYPAFFIPRMIAAAADAIPVRLEAVDSNGLMPLAVTEKPYSTAFSFRAFLHKHLRPHFEHFPDPEPFLEREGLGGARVDPSIAARWPSAADALLSGSPQALSALDIDHTVQPVAARGGMRAASEVLTTFLGTRLKRYKDERGVPDEQVASGLSPYLHFGHISSHEIFSALMTREGWTTRRLSEKGGGKREGWWNVPASAEAFLDQVVTWRELGFVTCYHRPHDYDRYESLPEWAQQTLGAHAARSARVRVHARRVRERVDARRIVERGAAAVAARWDHPQLPAHAVGQEDPRVDLVAAGGARGHDRAEQPVRARWARSQLVQRDLLGARSLRSPVGARAAGLWHHSVHEQREYRPEGEREEVPAHVRA